MKSNLLISEPPLQVLPSLAVKVGLNEAIILQQVHYWIENKKTSGKMIDGKKWIYNSYNEWRENFPFWSEKTIQRAFLSLEKKGIIVSKQGKTYARTKYYTIDYQALNMTNWDVPSGQNETLDDDNMSRSLTETTTKTTKDISDVSKSETSRTIPEPEKFECDDDGNPLRKTRKQKEIDVIDGMIHFSSAGKSPLEKKIALYPVDVQQTLADLVDIYKWPVSAIPEKSKGGNYALWIKDIHHINEMIQGHGRRALEATLEPCSKLDSLPGRPGSIIWCIPGIVGKMTKKQETAKVETAFSEHMKNYVPRRRE